MLNKAFDTAWDLLKQYAPNWREVAARLPNIMADYKDSTIDGRHARPVLLNEGSPIGWKEQRDLRLFGDEGSFMDTFIHPTDNRFVLKVPKKIHYEGEDWADKDPDYKISLRQGEVGLGNQALPEILESLGFPVISEFNTGFGTTVMPRIHPYRRNEAMIEWQRKNSADEEGYHLNAPQTLADRTLWSIVGDRRPPNWGVDQAGRWRMLDVDMKHNKDSDWWPNEEDYPKLTTTGEKLQASFDKDFLQLPATKILNILDNSDIYAPNLKRIAEAIEPHSENPKYVTYRGRPTWREGYDSL